jgi:hypothetical protein
VQCETSVADFIAPHMTDSTSAGLRKLVFSKLEEISNLETLKLESDD